jgi:hypothetical protein
MSGESTPGKPTTRRHGPEEKVQAARLVDAIRARTPDPAATWGEGFASMLAEWMEVERGIELSQQMVAEQVALEWRGALDSMVGEYFNLIARGAWQRGPSDMFNVIGIGRNEVRHSAMIAWLLDPLARHGLGPKLLQAILSSCFADVACDASGSVTVETEVTRGSTRADIVVWGRDFTVIIEVKIDAGEGDQQCDRLYEHFGGEPGARFLFLTPTGRRPKTATGHAAEAFRALSFSKLRDLLSELTSANGADLSEMGRSTARNYFRTLDKEFR